MYGRARDAICHTFVIFAQHFRDNYEGGAKPLAEEKRRKRVADSKTEQVHIIMPAFINGQRRLFGGKLMEWIDVVAGVVARRHAGAEVTTAVVDQLTFLKPAHINDTLTSVGQVTYVGTTSMEVRVDTFVESLNGDRELVNRAYLVMVAVDENEKPKPVPGLILETDEERQEWENAKKRRELRDMRRKEHI